MERVLLNMRRCFVGPRREPTIIDAVGDCMSQQTTVLVASLDVDATAFVLSWMHTYAHAISCKRGAQILRVQPHGSVRQVLKLVPTHLNPAEPLPPAAVTALNDSARVLLLIDASKATSPARVELTMLCWVVMHSCPNLPTELVQHIASHLEPGLLRDEQELVRNLVQQIAKEASPGSLHVSVVLCQAHLLAERASAGERLLGRRGSRGYHHHQSFPSHLPVPQQHPLQPMQPQQPLAADGQSSPLFSPALPQHVDVGAVSTRLNAGTSRLLRRARRRMHEALDATCSSLLEHAEREMMRGTGIGFVSVTAPSTQVLIAPELPTLSAAAASPGVRKATEAMTLPSSGGGGEGAAGGGSGGDGASAATAATLVRPPPQRQPRRLAQMLFFQELTYLVTLCGGADRAAMGLR